MALILPGAAVVTNNEIKDGIDPLWVGKERVEIKEARTWDPINDIKPVSTAANIQISGWAEGDDRRPAITEMSDGTVFITYQHDEGILTSTMGFAWNDNPDDAQAWFDSGVLLSLADIEQIYYPDTATCEHPDYELMNVFVSIDTEEAGGMYIPPQDPEYPDWYDIWEIYTWTSGAPEPEFAGISDGGWYQDLYYEDIIGPYNFYIYHEIYDIYDIVSCPIFFHNGIDAESGVGYFDAQSFEQTAPASDPDYVNLPEKIHTSIYNVDTEKVIWKKIDPSVETDYEFTPYQATVADGTNPAIAAYGDQVVIVYAHDGNIKRVYSSDDGETWSSPVTIGPGSYPDAIALGTTVFAAYENGGNLYAVSSSDGGATWSTPEKKNDQDGTVVAEENCIDVHEAGIVWVDERNEAYNIYYTSLVSPPTVPTIDGPSEGKPNTEYDFTATSTDPEGGQVWYWFDWGDGTNSGWLGPFASGTAGTGSHTWSTEEGFTIRAKAKDSTDAESDWAEFSFNTPRNKITFLQILIEKFPFLQVFLGFL
jgi:hypothetical protein